LGGTIGPKGLVQFEAIAYANGPDGKPNTPDDIILGPVQAKWSMQEFYATYGDDDTKFVGNLDSVSGLFTPAGEGPSMERQDMRNNYGDVWVVAEIEGPKGKPISGRSYLVVTVPQYLRFDQPEVAPNP
jgi:quinohemoprotein amine dehydrogenase